MVTNVSEKDKTLNEIIDLCTGMGQKMMNEANASGLDSMKYMGAAGAYMTVIKHCQDMLGYSGSRPSEVPNQSEDVNVRSSKPMNNNQWHVVWRESIEKYGKEMQSIVCMEECSELIQAISKRLRGKPDATDNLAEEMADVTICLYLLKEMYSITDEQLEEWIARKTARQSKRMQADDPFMEGEDVE